MIRCVTNGDINANDYIPGVYVRTAMCCQQRSRATNAMIAVLYYNQSNALALAVSATTPHRNGSANDNVDVQEGNATTFKSERPVSR